MEHTIYSIEISETNIVSIVYLPLEPRIARAARLQISAAHCDGIPLGNVFGERVSGSTEDQEPIDSIEHCR